MSDSFIEAYSALDARMKIVDVITNNLANANTIGFKRDFAHILQGETEFDVGTRMDLSSGDLIGTGNNLDAAINGEGFFAIETPSGERYTRAGSFGVNAAGELVTKDSLRVLSTSNQSIAIGDGKVEIRDGGVVMVDDNEVASRGIVTDGRCYRRSAWPGSSVLRAFESASADSSRAHGRRLSSIIIYRGHACRRLRCMRRTPDAVG